MRILLVGTFSGWMGIHMNQLAEGFRKSGAEVFTLDIHTPCRAYFGLLELSRERSQEKLGKIIRKISPDMILFNQSRDRIDFHEIRRYSDAKLCVWEFDGPNWLCYREKQWIPEVDLLLTVSRPMERELLAAGYSNVRYLPHGVDCSYYSPDRFSHTEIQNFHAPVSYIGRMTSRRVEFCGELISDGLALYGRRWHKSEEVRKSGLNLAVRSNKDLIGGDVVKVYAASGCMINILQEELAARHTILSLQVFAIPAAGSCLITEYTEELPEAFEPDKELFTFTEKEEMADKVHYCISHPDFAEKIGKAGRKRCLQCHTQEKRARQILNLL